MNLGFLDYAVIILLALALIWGFIRGFGKGTVKSLATYAGLACGYFVGVPVGRGLMNTTLGNEVLVSFYQGFLPSDGVFATPASLAEFSSAEQTAYLSEGLTQLSFPTFFQGMFISKVTLTDGTVARALASSFAFYTLLAICCIVFFLIAYVLVRIIFGKISEVLFGEDGRNMLGRLAGGVKKVVTMGFTICALMVVMVLIDQLMLKAGNETLHTFLDTDLKLNDGSSFSIARMFYNTASALLNWISL